jgi:hypothetical protein
MAGNSLATFWTLFTVCWTAFPTVFQVDLHRFRNSRHMLFMPMIPTMYISHIVKGENIFSSVSDSEFAIVLDEVYTGNEK